MAPLDSALPTDDAYLSTGSAAPPPKPEPVEVDASQYVEGWGARPELRGARGAPSVALGDNSLPPATEKMKLPAERYDHLEKENPQLHQIIDKAATDVGVPAIDLANIAFASSGFKKDTPGGYMNITPQDAKQLDPTGKFDPSDPIYNVYLGALKYKNLSDQYGVSTSSALGAYGADQDTVEAMARLSPEDQRKHYPQVYDYLRRLSAGITGKQPGMTAVDEPQKQEYQPPLGRPSGEPSQATQDVLRDRPTGDEPPAARTPLTGRWSNQGGPSVALQSQLRSVREQQNPPTDMAQVDAANAAQAAQNQRAADQQPQVRNPLPQYSGQQETQATRDILQAHEEMPDRPGFYSRGRAVSELPRGPQDLPVQVPADASSALTAALPPPAATAAPPPNDVSGVTEMQNAPTVVPTAALPGPPPPKPDAPTAWPPAAVAGNPPPGAAALPGAPAAPPAAGSSTPPATPPAGPAPAPGAPAGAPEVRQGGGQIYMGPAAPGAAPGAPGQPGQPTTAQLNQDELARIRAGQPPGPPGAPIPNVTTPSGAISQPVGQGGAGPAAPAVAAGRPAGEPPPIHGNGSVTLPGFFQATQQGGPQGGLSYGVANAPRGMSTNDMWAHLDSSLQRAFILKGDMVGVQRAREYVFQMQHAGSNQAMMQAYGALAVGDATGAANLLAKAHAFVPDGSTMAFKVGPNDPRTGQPTLWGQRFVDATGQPVGRPLQITPQGIAGMLNQTMDPQQFLKTLNTERQTMAKIAHNQNMEGLRNKAIDVTAGTAAAGRQERAREADQVQTGAQSRLEQTLAERGREADQAAEIRRQAKADADAKVAQSTRNAIDKRARDYYVDENSGVYVGGDMTQPQRNQSMDMWSSLRTYNPDMKDGTAVEVAQGILSRTHDLQEMRLKNGKTQYEVLNPQGKVIAYLPQAAVTSFGKSPTLAAAPAAPAAQAQPQQGQVKPAPRPSGYVDRMLRTPGQ